MPLFTSSREKRLWLYSLIILVAIIATLVFTEPLLKIFEKPEEQSGLFSLAMFLIGSLVLVHGLRNRTGNSEIVIWLGILAVYLLLFLRLGIAERSHMLEYSVLTIFIHKALVERRIHRKKMPNPAFLALILTFLIGVLDETVQIFLPERVFDPIDILFNGLAALMAVLAIVILQWARKKATKNSEL